jgi:diamine N-acetyltransferase
MLTSRAEKALDYRPISRADLDDVCRLEFDPVQLQEFLGPIDQIVDEVRRGLAHRMIGINDCNGLVGFIVVHPDPRDHSCWWLAWFAIDRSHQGRGYGRIALCHATSLLARMDGCRRIRLLVADGNTAARHIYDRAGFDDIGQDDEGWHIMEYVVPSAIPSGDPFAAYRLAHAGAMPAKRARRRLRLRPATGRNPARTIGTTRAPPEWAGHGMMLDQSRPASIAGARVGFLR